MKHSATAEERAGISSEPSLQVGFANKSVIRGAARRRSAEASPMELLCPLLSLSDAWFTLVATRCASRSAALRFALGASRVAFTDAVLHQV